MAWAYAGNPPPEEKCFPLRFCPWCVSCMAAPAPAARGRPPGPRNAKRGASCLPPGAIKPRTRPALAPCGAWRRREDGGVFGYVVPGQAGPSSCAPAAKDRESLAPLGLPALCGGGGSRAPGGGRALSAASAAPRACPRCGPSVVCGLLPRSGLKVERPAGP